MSAPIVFLLGAPRSGTTLLRVMLAGHPALFSPPEMVLAPFTTMAQRRARLEERFWEKGGMRLALMNLLGIPAEEARKVEDGLVDRTIPEVYAWLRERLAERILVDKCPHLAAEPEALVRLAGWFPDARWILLVRHPGSVIRSLQNMPMAEVMLQGYGGDARRIWSDGNRAMQAFIATIPSERTITVRYEDIVGEGARITMERICETIGVPFDAATLTPYEGDRMRDGAKGARAIGDPNMAGRGKVQPELATAWLAGFDASALDVDDRALARSFGYDIDALPRPAIGAVTDALDALWRTVRTLEADIQLPMDLDAVEGRRFLLRMLASATDTFVEHGDADRPSFQHSEGPTRKMFADCPDADYLRAPLRMSADRIYRVTGRIPPGTLHVSLVLYGKGGRVVRGLRDAELGADADGRFTVRIATTEPTTEQSGPWLRCDGDETAVILRQYFRDRSVEVPVTASIRLLGEVGAPPPLDAAGLAEGLGRARRMVETVFARTVQAWKMLSAGVPNRFLDLEGEGLFPTPDNKYRVAWYRFGADQLLFVRGRIPRARYFSVCLYNAWMESLDYTGHRVCLNHTQIQTDADGNFEICLAHSDPGHPNWLDTSGHHAGYALARSLLPEETPEPFIVQVLYAREWTAPRTPSL